ncbi:MAG: methyl-accepting chemotaxis protein [Alicyclobacillaceae bacterium]|nr:methyl-accepting chemotaxis protein [Alicyclobacillaceae bacterium]
MRLSIKLKVILLFSLVIILGTASMATFASLTVKTEVTEALMHKVSSDLALGKALLDAKIPGEWSLRDGRLYKGNTPIDGNVTVVDEIGAATGNAVTIFQGNIRVATNVKNPDGQRALGTPVSEAVAQATLKERRTYVGLAQVVGQWDMTAYEPIQDARGEVIGIWGMGVPIAPYLKLQTDFRNRVIAFGVAGLVVAIAVSWAVASRMAAPLLQVAHVAKRVAQGDLQVEEVQCRAKDEIGELAQSINAMVENLRALIRKVSQASEHVAAASEELFASAEQTVEVTNRITAVVQEVAGGAKSQVRQSEESATAVGEMAAGTQRIAESATLVSQSSVETASRAEEGNERVQKAVHQMDSIRASVQESASAISLLEQRSKQIGQIVEVISGIAAQTNLLALNAAIEAARAGEHGRGFVVVAEEVRKLAEQSKQSADQIAGLIQTIQEETKRSVEAMDMVTREVRSGIQAVQEAGEAFEHILNSVRNVADQIQEISAATQELSAGAEEISTTVEHMAQVAKESMGATEKAADASEEQLAAMQEVSSSAHSLSRMAQELQDLIHRFKV